MRLFFAIRFPASIQNELAMIQDLLRGSALKGNFTLKENIHLTLVFLGQVDEARCPELHGVLTDLKLDPFDIMIDSLGHFDKRDGKIIWLGIQPQPELFDCQSQLSDTLRDKGFNFEDNPYKPHVTLGRGIRHNNGQSPIPPKFKPIHIHVSRISLMVSERFNGILRYREIDGIDL